MQAVRSGIEALDDLIDENYKRHPLKEQQEMSFNYRNIGLGAFGYATALMKLGYKYGSPEAIKFTDDIFSLMFKAAVIKSNELAKEKGPFPKYTDAVLNSSILRKHFSPDEIDSFRSAGLRNCSLLSIAPNGTLSTLLNESGGVEPEFAIKYTRRTVGMTDGEDKYYDIYCKAAKEYMKLYSTNALPDYFVGSSDIAWKDRVAVQAAMQNHIDTAISSTINLPNSATIEDVEHIYLEAWRQGLKGITIFRDGCERMSILSTSKPEANKEEDDNVLRRGDIIATSSNLVGLKRTLQTGCGSLHCTAFFTPDTGEFMEVYLSKGSAGGCLNNMTGLSRMMSLAARGGIPLGEIIDQLDSCGSCPSYAVRKATKHDTSKGSCCPSAVGNALRDMAAEMRQIIVKGPIVQKSIEEKKENLCPECNEPLISEGGCVVCKACGWSKCG